MTREEMREKVARAICTADEQNGGPPWEWYIAFKREKGIEEHFDRADAAIAVVLEEAASLKFLRPLVEKQSLGEWNDKTIDEDVAMFAAAIRALGKP